MKDIKLIAAVVSAVALSACGGGSGGGGGSPVTPGGRAAVTDAAVASNHDITSMTSELLFASNGHGTARSATLGRSGSVIHNGQTYTSYRLDDVTFKMGGEDSRIVFDVDDEGRIIALKKLDRNDDFTGNPTYALSEEGRFARKGTTGNEFGKILYIYNVSGAALDYTTGVDPIASDHFHDGIKFMNDSGDLSASNIKTELKKKLRKEIDKIKASQKDDPNDEGIHAAYLESLTKLENAYNTYATRIDAMASFNPSQAAYTDVTVQGVDIGLKFADLGFAELMTKADPSDADEDALEHTFTPYVGGYGVLKTAQADLDKDRVFTGTAIAGIDHKKKGYTDGTNIEEGVLVRQDNATLTLRKDGSSTLVMNDLKNKDNASQHWYNVQVDKAANGLPTFTITGTNTITGKYDGAAAYNLPKPELADGTPITFASENWEAHEQNYVKHVDDNNRVSGNAETTLYRLENDNAHAEATSLFNFANEYHSDDNVKHNEVGFYGAFGSGTSIPVGPRKH